jgi:periplasmic protein TonB
MSPILYAINIGTLATWLSVAGFGTVGIVIPVTRELLGKEQSADPYKDLESTVFTDGFSSESLPPAQQTETGSTGEAEEIDVPLTEQETLPTPPEMPDVVETTPLPEIPDMPQPAAKPTETAAPAPTKPRAVPRQNSKAPTRSNLATSPTGGSTAGKAEAKGKAGNGGRNGGSGLSDAQRLASGYKPRPPYPASARSKGHAGTVLVEFVIEENGRVTSAYVKKSSGWPELDQSAVSNMRRWKFSPGKRDKRSIPIIFQLN